MYSAPYGYGNAAGQPFNGAPPGQNPQMQPQPGPNQPQQQMMYNQQFPMGPGGAFPGAANPGAMMPGGAGPAGMMQNTAMPQMSANGQMGFQAPFTSSPYGPNVPSTAAPQGQYNPNYMMANPMGGYPMNPNAMNAQQQQHHQQQQQQHQQQQQQQQQQQAPQQQHQQHHQQQQQQQHQQQQHQHQLMMQRMHQAQQNQAGMGTPNPQRHFSTPQGTPNPIQQQQQGHFGTPQNHQVPPQLQTPAPAPPPAHSVTTPQTPTFPSAGQSMAVNGSSTPISPGTQARDQERMSLLLDINTELLFEVIQLKHNIEEIRKEAATNAANGQSPEQQKDAKEEEEALEQDYNQVFRRLQANLGYLANLTTNKPGVPRQPAPMILSAPPLNSKLKLRPLPSGPDADKVDSTADGEQRGAYIEELYKRLHGLFPGIDPTKEPMFRPHMKPGGPNPAMAAHNAQRMASIAAAQGQMPGNAAPSPASSAHQTTPQMTPVPGLPSTQSSMSTQ